MKDNFVTISSLECPTKPLECALVEILKNFTTLDLSIADGILTVTVNGVSQTIELP